MHCACGAHLSHGWHDQRGGTCSLATIAAKPNVSNRKLYGGEQAVAEQWQDGAAVGGEESSLTISSEL